MAFDVEKVTDESVLAARLQQLKERREFEQATGVRVRDDGIVVHLLQQPRTSTSKGNDQHE